MEQVFKGDGVIIMDDWSQKTRYFSPRQFLTTMQELYEDIQELRAQNEALSKRIAHFERKEQEKLEQERRIKEIMRTPQPTYKQIKHSRIKDQEQKKMEQAYRKFLEKSKHLNIGLIDSIVKNSKTYI